MDLPNFNNAPEWKQLRKEMGVNEWAIVETLNGRYILKTLSAADKAGDSIEAELYGTKSQAKAAMKKHINELKESGVI